MEKELCIVGVSYKTAPVEIRERFALTDPTLMEKDIIPLGKDIHECMILSTCNRVEILVLADTGVTTNRLAELWSTACKENITDLQTYLYVHKNEEAVKHLFSVASGLDSMVIGEPQILGQLKDAYRNALQKKSAKAVLSSLLHKSFTAAKRVRSQTAVAAGAVSVSYAAVQLAKHIFEDMSKTSALLIGAGETAELAATHLIGAGVTSMQVTNRTFERAVQLAERFSGTAVPFEALLDALVNVDIIISSTGAHEPILRAKDLKAVMHRRKNKPMFFIDIAVPRDIEAEANLIDNIYLYDIDDLKEVEAGNLNARKEEAVKAAKIIEEEALAFNRWLKSLALQPTIIDILHKGEEIAAEEVERVCKRLGNISDEQRAAFTGLASSIIKKMHHDPITFLKRHFHDEEGGAELISTMRAIFNLDQQDYSEHPHQGRPHKTR